MDTNTSTTPRHRARWTKVTAAQVRELRAAWATGTVRQKDLAVQYGLTPSAVSRICNRQVWPDEVPQ